MKTFLVTYSLSNPVSTYTNLITFLKTAPQWARPMDGVWIIKTTSDVTTIRDGIKDRILPTDKVLVVTINPKGWGTFNVGKIVTDWMKEKLS